MVFDPNTFLDQTIDKPLATDYQLVPEGEYQMMVGDIDEKCFETFQFTYKRGPKAGQPGEMTVFNCPIIVLDDAVKATMKKAEVRTRARFTLSFDPKTGLLSTEPDRNVELGRLMNAVGLNAQGTPLRRLSNAGPFLGRVVHEAYDEKNPERKNAEVKRFAPIR